MSIRFRAGAVLATVALALVVTGCGTSVPGPPGTTGGPAPAHTYPAGPGDLGPQIGGPAPAQTYQWRCVVAAYPFESSGYNPQVTIANTSRDPLPVSDIATAVFDTTGSQVDSVDVSPHLGTAYIAPGASMTFTWVPGDPTLSGPDPAQDTCKIENLS